MTAHQYRILRGKEEVLGKIIQTSLKTTLFFGWRIWKKNTDQPQAAFIF